MIGTKLAHYEITSHLGSGGMGDVYQATDTKLGRTVAIKFLPEVFSDDTERVARFQREARVLASLNHSNIAAIYGVEETDSRHFLVMELVSGETLADRIKRGAIPIEEALSIAKQIAEALEEAHEKGVVHRDLKPANIKVTPDGKVKVLDFGLAKAYERDQADPSVSNSPTISMAATNAGVILGTAAYMSPEQAKGRRVDRRTDIFAFGAVLYEMLTGRPAFDGDDVQDILGSILKSEPDWTRLPSDVPPSVRKLLRLCLEKNAKNRRSDATDVRLDIEQASNEMVRPMSMASPPVVAIPKSRERLVWAAAVVVLLAVAAVSAPYAFLHFRESAPETRSIRFVMLAPEKATVLGTPPAISPDGRRVVFVANLEGKTQLWVRPLDSVTAEPLPGTDGADYPFWSPDSRFIGFFAGGKLKKIEASGGPPQTVSDAPSPRGGTWNRDGVIVFTPSITGPLHRVASSGGASTPITTVDASRGETSHRGPSFLPDGRHFLFLALGGEKQGIYLGSLDSKDRQLLVNAASAGVYASPGYVLFVNERSLVAQRLDLKNLQMEGEAFPIAEPVGLYNNLGVFSVSDNGVLVDGIAGGGGFRQLAWYDRAGKLIERIGPSAGLFDLALSPEQKRAAVQLRSPAGNNDDIWVVDLARGVLSRLTFHIAVEDWPVWSPDGTRILFNSTRDGIAAMYQKVASGAGTEELLLKTNTPISPTDWSRDGRFILYENVDPKTKADLWVLPLFGDRKPQVFLQTPFSESQARFSSDGRWIAYVSDESGREEVYVQSFPPSGGKWQVSTNGGLTPRWRGDGKEMFYLSPDRRIMSVDVRAGGATFEISSAKILFEAPVDGTSVTNTNRYDVTPDGQRFLINAAAESTTSASTTVAVNWFAGPKNRP